MPENDSTVPDGFRLIPGFPRYCISEDGTILSICITGNGSYRNLPWNKARRIVPALDTYGYERVVLRDGKGGGRQVYVHALVLETYVGNRPCNHDCRHLDGNKLNNHLSNLKWGTRKENVHDMRSHGTACQGERQWNSKLTVDDVLEIRQLAANGELHRVIAEQFHVRSHTISRIASRTRWNHI